MVMPSLRSQAMTLKVDSRKAKAEGNHLAALAVTQFCRLAGSSKMDSEARVSLLVLQ